MKMGTIASPWHYDAAAAQTIRPDNLGRTAILRYASWAGPDCADGPVTLRLPPFRSIPGTTLWARCGRLRRRVPCLDTRCVTGSQPSSIRSLGMIVLDTFVQQSSRPFRIDVPQATLDRILNRVREAQFPDRLDGNDWRYGTDWDYMKALADYWAKEYDWRKAEAILNRYPQFVARVNDYDIHFYHVKGRGPKPMPLVLTHGWPGSVFEFLEAIGPLSDPASYGGSPEDAFDVVVPSLPGFGFSSKPKGKPIGPATTAALWDHLMTGVLGYAKYGAQGGDLANGIQVQLGRTYPNSLVGLHFNGIAITAAPLPPEAEQTPEERAYVRALAAYRL